MIKWHFLFYPGWLFEIAGTACDTATLLEMSRKLEQSGQYQFLLPSAME
jgi:hypothetical protein